MKREKNTVSTIPKCGPVVGKKGRISAIWGGVERAADFNVRGRVLVSG